jgi:DNA helicase-2/ATP-dependent DNA helicase PcrA
VTGTGAGSRAPTDALNPAQRAAVCARGANVLVVAGAGSGKTRVLTHRVAHLLHQERVPAGRILAVTFTNKAAEEMAARVERLMGAAPARAWISTFHAFALRLLRQEAPSCGLPPEFLVFDQDDQRQVMRECLKQLGIGTEQLSPALALQRISRAKNQSDQPEEYLERLTWRGPPLASIFRLYQAALRRQQALDFDDLILRALALLEAGGPGDLPERSEAARRWRGRFLHLLIDEFQDINPPQYRLIRALAGPECRVCAVGDQDQSIYRWRGSDASHFQRFERDFAPVQRVVLEQNYRSTQTILAAANAVVAQNLSRIPKELWTRNAKGAPLELMRAYDDQGEAALVVDRIRELRGGLRPDQIAVLYRTNAQSRAFEEALLQHGIHYQVVGGLRFYERKEIKDALAYLRLALNPLDQVSFLRALATPGRGVGEKSVERLLELAQSWQCSPLAVIREHLPDSGLAPRIRVTLERFASLCAGLTEAAPTLRPREFLVRVYRDSGLLHAFDKEGEVRAQSRLENLDELINVAAAFQESFPQATVADFLDRISLLSDADYEDQPKKVLLMTLHAAKGLEFPLVFLVGLEEGVFPHQLSLDDADQLEEERRLCYVGMTRARERLVLSWAQRRRVQGSYRELTPSRFLAELPAELLRSIAERGAARSPARILAPPRRESGLRYEPVDDGFDDDAPAGPRPGTRVFHPKFGEGVVLGCEGRGADAKLTVRFASVGPRKLIARYLMQ